ncbi:MAG: modification methylase [Candidatus Altiarchaeales archaeon WOR_SM1_86-2]|nr:MAG: modification methylase [Candidatus Altiarchaeales archaeon WOR_SM1_79]ODS37434.1 MAG: modification methylase [Candidatus Altiarchaeales archaeon WOR_SM1_86-2]
MKCDIIHEDCEQYLKGNLTEKFDLSFLDPPFNQNKEYSSHNDSMPEKDYWDWMKRVCTLILKNTSEGGAIYFMQREKNTQYVLETLESSGWTFQNLIIWKKKTSAVPCEKRFGKHYQIIVFATKGETPRVFNKLRINPPLLVTEKHHRPRGVYVTDVWDDIRELTSGYFAGDEPLRFKNGERAHKQQSPVRLLARIILSSSKVSDTVFDPFAGTGTTLVAARQLQRNSIGIEIDPTNVSFIENRLSQERRSDNILKCRDYYIYTENLDRIWPLQEKGGKGQTTLKSYNLQHPSEILS